MRSWRYSGDVSYDSENDSVSYTESGKGSYAATECMSYNFLFELFQHLDLISNCLAQRELVCSLDNLFIAICII